MQTVNDSSAEAAGVLLVNLGTPDAPTPVAVRRYLKEFLWDPRVVDVPRGLWWLILNLIILNTRPRRSAAAYARVWMEEGSPLLVISRRQHAALQKALGQRTERPPRVVLAMRYGQPSILAGLAALRSAGVGRVLVLPLYPQFSHTTTTSVKDAVEAAMRGSTWQPELRYVEHYYRDPAYIMALAGSVRRLQAGIGMPDRLLMSFHGIPQDYVEAGDPYARQCAQTAKLLATALGLEPSRWIMTFQSRLGPKQWLQPYTDVTLRELAQQGVKNVQIICPGFSADCLETLEEVAMENRDIFLEAGGEVYDYIPCLNDHPSHIDLFVKLVDRYLAE
jgi:ferrochelatase